MMTPLALIGAGRHFTFMTSASAFFFSGLISVVAAGLLSVPASAQTLPEPQTPALDKAETPEEQPQIRTETPQEAPSERPQTQTPNDLPSLPDAAPAPELDDDNTPSLSDGLSGARPDIIITSDAEREDKLAALFEKLKNTEDSDDANLVAEEIWAVWLRSGSASIDYVLARGADAQKRGNLDLAGRMFDHVVRLEPSYAEGWVRSGRLALDQGDLGRAVSDCLQGLIYEPRHFYAWWTLGNIFEQLGQRDAAFDAYSEAAALYPALKAVTDRIEYLSSEVEGESL